LRGCAICVFPSGKIILMYFDVILYYKGHPRTGHEVTEAE